MFTSEKVGQSDIVENDISIIKLDKPVQLSSTLYPICLSAKNVLIPGDSAISAGYGLFRKNSFEPKLMDYKLRSVKETVKECPGDTDNVCVGSLGAGTEEVSFY